MSSLGFAALTPWKQKQLSHNWEAGQRAHVNEAMQTAYDTFSTALGNRDPSLRFVAADDDRLIFGDAPAQRWQHDSGCTHSATSEESDLVYKSSDWGPRGAPLLVTAKDAEGENLVQAQCWGLAAVSASGSGSPLLRHCQ